MANLNTCPHCSKERVSDGDWETCMACAPILEDYPDLDRIENDQARKVVMGAFQAVQKLRCDFLAPMNWRGCHPKDCPQVEDDDTIKLPHWMSLRPTAMIRIENEMIDLAMSQSPQPIRYVKALSDIDLNYMAKIYVERFEAFLVNQRNQALGLAGR